MFKGFETTGIGSLPLNDAAEACKVVFEHVTIPFWPQLPRRSFYEFMIPQYTEGFPFTKIQGEHVFVERTDSEAVASFYEAIEKDAGFPISREYAPGFYTFIDLLKQRGEKFNIIKGHVTGPLTFTLSLTDEKKRPVFFDEEMRELTLYLLKGKARWQIEALKAFGEKVIIFIDEPILSALGTSTYVGVSTEEALRILRDIVDYIHGLGALAGIHCCGKADWPMVIASGINILNLDAYFYWDTLGLYPEEIKAFISKGGIIAWGVVPTTDAIRKVTLQGLIQQLERGLGSLERIGISPDTLRRQSILTPSCGTGSMEVEDAMKVFSLLRDLRNTYAKG